MVGGLVSMPAWANHWNAATLPSGSSFLSANASNLLAEVAETILPATSTPGAKELGVHTLVEKIVNDCMDKKAQNTLAKGLEMLDANAKQKYSKAFVDCDTNQRTTLLKEMETSTDETAKGFYSMVKGLTIRGYLTSEYVMTNLTNYQMAPGFYHGCVPVAAK